jgi:hypothetical protein
MKKPFRESGRALFFRCDESSLSVAIEKTKRVSERSELKAFHFSHHMEVRHFANL